MNAIMGKLLSRKRLTIGSGAIIVLILAFAFWPSAIQVDMGKASIAPMIVTIDEEAKTRVRDNYVVAAPVSGRLLRVDAHAGDTVEGHATILARISPSDPSFLDIRTQTQAEAAIRGAEAALAFARADVSRAQAEVDYALTERNRFKTLLEREAVSQAALDRAELALRTARATLQTARASIGMREAELENARAQLVTPGNDNDEDEDNAGGNEHGVVFVRAPVSGRVLRILQESETTIAAGTPIAEIGDPLSDLEIEAELLSTDAVQVEAGDRAIIEKWGGGAGLEAVVERIEPFGFTKFSALGVEEQRVRAILSFISPPEDRAGLGHGFRVEARIVIWEDETALNIPSSALYRDGEDWSVFAVRNGRARKTILSVGHNNGVQAEILDGLADGDALVLYPSDQITDGARVKQRQMR